MLTFRCYFKDMRAPTRISKIEGGEKDHQIKRPIKDSKGGNSETQTKPDASAQKRKRSGLIEPDGRADKKKKPDDG